MPTTREFIGLFKVAARLYKRVLELEKDCFETNEDVIQTISEESGIVSLGNYEYKQIIRYLEEGCK